MKYYDIEHNAGFYTYVQYEPFSLRTIKWLIPEGLHNNEIVKAQMRSEPFDELIKHINSIGAYNLQLNNLYLDIEMKSIKKRKQFVKEQCYQIIEDINKGLSPYHWEMHDDTSSNRRDSYLIGLFQGEDEFLKRIKEM